MQLGTGWVSALAKYDFWLEYQKGWDNAVADALSPVTTRLELETVQTILDGATVGTSQRVEGENPAIIESDQQLEQEVWVASGRVLVEMHVTDWAAVQKEDLELDADLQWLESKKEADPRTLLRECIMSKEGWMVWRNHQNFTYSEAPSTCAPPPKGRMRICYSSLYPKCIKLLP